MDAIDSDEVRSGQGVRATNERLPSPLVGTTAPAAAPRGPLRDEMVLTAG